MKTLRIPVVCLWLALLCVTASARADEVRMLCDFERPADLKLWDVSTGHAALVTDGATHGTHALQLTFDPAGRYHPAYISSYRLPRDWSHFDALVLDVWNPSDRPMPGYLLVGDAAWQQKGSTYWNRHNSSTTFPPGHTEWTIPVRGLYRGEAGSRNNDIKRNIDPDSIVRVDFGFGARGAERARRHRRPAAGQGRATGRRLGLRLRPAQPGRHARLDGRLARHRLRARPAATAGARAAARRGTAPTATPPSAPPSSATSARPAATTSTSTCPPATTASCSSTRTPATGAASRPCRRSAACSSTDASSTMRNAPTAPPTPSTASRTSSPSAPTPTSGTPTWRPSWRGRSSSTPTPAQAA